jgi:hypothetical protein
MAESLGGGKNDYNNLDNDIIITGRSKIIFLEGGYYYGIKRTRDIT